MADGLFPATARGGDGAEAAMGIGETGVEADGCLEPGRGFVGAAVAQRRAAESVLGCRQTLACFGAAGIEFEDTSERGRSFREPAKPSQCGGEVGVRLDVAGHKVEDGATAAHDLDPVARLRVRCRLQVPGIDRERILLAEAAREGCRFGGTAGAEQRADFCNVSSQGFSTAS